MQRPWTLAETNRMRAMLNDKTNAEIGAALGRSESSVCGRLCRLGWVRTAPEKSDGISTTMTLSPRMKMLLQTEADRRNITIGSVVREIVAKHFRLENEKTIAVHGGKSRKAPEIIVRSVSVPRKPSMPFVNIGRD
jgi:hypothetical protein